MYRMRITNEAGTDFLNLLHSGLRIVNYGWKPGAAKFSREYVASPYGPSVVRTAYNQPVIETFSLGYSGCEKTMRTALYRLKTITDKINQWHEFVSDVPYWLEWWTKDEVHKWSLLYGATWEPANRGNYWPMLDNGILLGTLALERHPLWEDKEETAALSIPVDTPTVGGIHWISDVPGTAPARITQTIMVPDVSIDKDAALTKLWMGIRSCGPQGCSHFNPVWECEMVADGGHATSLLADSVSEAELVGGTESNAFHLKVDFTSATVMTPRIIVYLETVAAAYRTEYLGRYLVLGRCAVEDDTKPAIVQMRYGFVDTDTDDTTATQAFNEVTIDSESWNFYELGEITISPLGSLGTVLSIPELNELNYCAIVLSASGTANDNLYVDCLVLVPTEHFVYVGDGRFYTDPANMGLGIITAPNERVVGINLWQLTQPASRVTPEPKSWYLPQGDSFIVFAAQRSTESEYGDELYGSLRFVSRWEDYREPNSTAPSLT